MDHAARDEWLIKRIYQDVMGSDIDEKTLQRVPPTLVFPSELLTYFLNLKAMSRPAK